MLMLNLLKENLAHLMFNSVPLFIFSNLIFFCMFCELAVSMEEDRHFLNVYFFESFWDCELLARSLEDTVP